MKVLAHQIGFTIGDFNERLNYLKKLSFDGPTLHLFPELFLTGYPIQDLCINQAFISQYQAFLDRINNWSLNLPESQSCLLLGGLHYEFNQNGRPGRIYNSILLLEPGKKLRPHYHKQLLPNYDIFDEKKYFSPGNAPSILEWQNKRIGLLICEDMWKSDQYDLDPVEELWNLSQDEPLDLVINLSASPFYLGKEELRKMRVQEISNQLKCPFLYLNSVCAEDEIIFDGSSFCFDGNEVLYQAPAFQQCQWELPTKGWEFQETGQNQVSNKESTNHLFAPYLDFPNGKLPQIKVWTEKEAEACFESLIFGLQQYAQKTGFQNFVVALSGGIDSAVVLALTKLAFQNAATVEAVYMPGKYSANISFELSCQLCRQLNVAFKTIPIKFLHSAFNNAFLDGFGEGLTGLADENIQSRIRGSILYARSNTTGAMPLNTSNKSELAVGYSTLYGDSVGSLSLLGDLYKSEVYQLAEYINLKFNQLIPQEIISRPPSAELRPDQRDDQSLPPYERLDAILECILSYHYSHADILNFGFDPAEVKLALNLLSKAEYKRYQFCPILKVKPKSFGFGYRNPICKNQEVYLDE